jgi:hypothetical protein
VTAEVVILAGAVLALGSSSSKGFFYTVWRRIRKKVLTNSLWRRQYVHCFESGIVLVWIIDVKNEKRHVVRHGQNLR